MIENSQTDAYIACLEDAINLCLGVINKHRLDKLIWAKSGQDIHELIDHHRSKKTANRFTERYALMDEIRKAAEAYLKSESKMNREALAQTVSKYQQADARMTRRIQRLAKQGKPWWR